jgi:hypothetical protein
MIHWIAGRERVVVVVESVEEEDERRVGRCWGHLPSRGEREAGDSRGGCVGGTVHVDRGRVGGHGNGEGETRRR